MRKMISFAAVLFAATAFVTAHAQQGPTDAQIAKIVVTANQVDIDAGKLAARSHGVEADVEAFAQPDGHRPHGGEQAGHRRSRTS